MQSSATIIAVSSPPGRSPRGLVRLSGSEATTITGQLLAEPLPDDPRVAHADQLRLDGFDLPCLVYRFAAPHSFTGEDMVELQCPGHPALLDRLVRRMVEAGARLAEPGEFAFRAFLHGKIDLTQAEGIHATITAASDVQLHAAALLRGGRLGKLATQLVDALATQLALVEAGIDFTDQEDVVPIAPPELGHNLAALRDQLDDILKRSRAWGAIEALPRVVLVGAPSTGKSTLFNALLGRARAVINPMHGTTRDILAEPLTLRDPSGRPCEVMLVDMAGLDEPRNALDTDVQAAARRAIDEAELLLLIDDGESHAGRLHVPDNTPVAQLTVRTKCDLHPSDTRDINVCAPAGEGVDELRRAIAHRLADRGVSIAADRIALQPRHDTALRGARDGIRRAIDRLAAQPDDHAIESVELVAGDLRAALDELACLGGQMSPDDVIGRVFATFCVGK